MKTGITFQITLLVVLLIILSSIGIGTTVLRHEKQTLTEARDQRGNLLVKNLTVIAKTAIPSDNFLTIITHCHSLVTNETDVKQAMVIDTNWTILAHNNPSMMGKECTSDRCTEILEEEKFSIGHFTCNTLFHHLIKIATSFLSCKICHLDNIIRGEAIYFNPHIIIFKFYIPAKRLPVTNIVQPDIIQLNCPSIIRGISIESPRNIGIGRSF